MNQSESVLLLSLIDTDRLEILANSQPNQSIIPTRALRPVISWAIDRFHESNRTVAPTREALLETWGQHLEDQGIDLPDAEDDADNTEWAIDQLKAQHILKQGQDFTKEFAQQLATADVVDRQEILNDFAGRLIQLSSDMQPKTSMLDGEAGFQRAYDGYLVRMSEEHIVKGLTLGIPAPNGHDIDEHLFGIHPGELAVMAAPSKVGKALEVSQRVLTPTGWKTIGEIKVGDTVIGSDGRGTRVLATRRWANRPLMRVTTDDGASVLVDENHDWTIRPTGYAKPHMVVDTRTLGKKIVTNKRYAFLPVMQPAQYEVSAPLPVDPYIFGVLLGDGNFTGHDFTFCKPDPWLHEEVARRLPAGDRLVSRDSRGTSAIIGGATRTAYADLGMKGLHSWEKFVPDAYMRASAEDRGLLLSGLLDTDGGVEGKCVSFCSTSFELASAVQQLAWSLGGTARIKHKPFPKHQNGVGRPAWIVIVRLGYCPFRLPRKAEAYANRGTVNARPATRRIVSVEAEGIGETVCIQVAAADSLFVTEGYLLTHNSWILGAAALNEAKRGRISVLFTLENSVADTYDRFVAMSAKIRYANVQRGTLEPEEVERFEHFMNVEVPALKETLYVIQPAVGQRTVTSMIRQAQTLGADSVFIDQLSFVEHPDEGRKPRHEVLKDIMHELKTLISTAKKPIPVMIAHQINREGIKKAKESGQLSMEQMAESAEIERTADFVFGLHQTQAEKLYGTMTLQTLAARRVQAKHWELAWMPWDGFLSVQGERVFDE